MKIALVGNIAVFKSTTLNVLAKRGYSRYEESVSEWGDLLKLSYINPAKYTDVFQMRIISDQTDINRILSKRDENEIIFLERSTHDGLRVFMEAKKEEGWMDQIQVDEFNRFVQKTGAGVYPDRIVYLRQTPEQSYEQMLTRARPDEKEVGLEYHQLLHKLHEKVYGSGNCELPTLVIDSEDAEKNADLIEGWLKSTA